MKHYTLIAATVATALSPLAFAADKASQTTDATSSATLPASSHQQNVTTAQSDGTQTTTTQSDGTRVTTTQSDDTQSVTRTEAVTEMAATPGSDDDALLKGYRVRASDLLGAEVANNNNEEIGEIDDLIIGDDQKLQAVLSVGGFLGIGDHRVTVPFDELNISREAGGDDIEVVYDVSRTDLEGKEAFSYREGDLSWRERLQHRMGDWTDKAKNAVQNVTGDAETVTQ